ncbi:MAG: ABC transporter permease [Actinomycetota bacterium]
MCAKAWAWTTRAPSRPSAERHRTFEVGAGPVVRLEHTAPDLRIHPRSHAIAAALNVTERTSESIRFRPTQRVRELFAYREILLNLVRKELKVKYTASVLGAVWSILNPIVFLAVFTFVVKILGNATPHYPVFLLSGLLAWNLFSVATGNGTRSVIDNGNLVKKVAFPREILPLSVVGVALVDFVLQSMVLLAFILVSGYGMHASALVLYPLSFVTLVVFTTALVFWVSALNVRYRDIQHLIGLALLVWFWMTPIVYPGGLVQDKLTDHSYLWILYLLNPLTPIVSGFQRGLYATVSYVPAGQTSPTPVLPAVSVAWLIGVISLTLVVSCFLLLYAWRLFFRLSGDFAEEL